MTKRHHNTTVQLVSKTAAQKSMDHFNATHRNITKLYVVYDKVMNDLFGAIIRAPNDEVARRSFHDLMLQKEGPIAGHRQDYDLLLLGAIDNTGQIWSAGQGDTTPLDHLVEVIVRGQDWLDANTENTK